jgi:hypothetical protein
MTAAIASLTAFPSAVVLVSGLAGLASLINALELLWIMRVWTSTPSRGAGTPAVQQRFFVHDRRAFAVLLVVQCVAAVALSTREGAAWAAILMFTTYVSALRLRGNVNGGSDAMLFTVLGGLTLARLDAAPMFWREAGLLYIAAQLLLSYLRAGLAKAQHRAWWTGEALRDFMKLPAYGVPAGIWSTPPLLRAASIAVIVFECASPLVFVHPRICALFIAAALVFHAMTAMLFGLNRFFLTWTAALPSLFYAVHRVQ